MRYTLVSCLFALITSVSVASAPAKESADSVGIDQRDYQIVMAKESVGSGRTAKVILMLHTTFTLRSQAKAHLRAAINLDGPESFQSVFAKEVSGGPKPQKQELNLTIERPKQKVVRVLVWLDKNGGTSTPAPLGSDNIAFDSAAFLNLNDR